MTAKFTSAGMAATSLGATTVTITAPPESIPILDFIVWSGQIGQQPAFMTVQHATFLTTAILGAVAVMFTLRREWRFGGRVKK